MEGMYGNKVEIFEGNYGKQVEQIQGKLTTLRVTPLTTISKGRILQVQIGAAS